MNIQLAKELLNHMNETGISWVKGPFNQIWTRGYLEKVIAKAKGRL